MNPELSKKCKAFVISHWGLDGLKQVKERPVSWVRHQANPHIKLLRRKQKHLPLIAIRGTINRIHLELSTEKAPIASVSSGSMKKGAGHV